MKKSCLVFSILIFIRITASSQSCLPEGIWFSNQTEIDSFQVNYPCCTELSTDAWISGSGITNLNGLSVLTSIEEALLIRDNQSLTSLAGLYNLTSIGGDLYIRGNDALPSLAGLDNINSESIFNLSILENNSLSICDVQNICDYLASPTGLVWIMDNAPGCFDQPEVEAACGIALTADITPGCWSVYPNPFKDQITFNIQLQEPAKVSLVVFNNMGQAIATIVDEFLSQGSHQVTWKAGSLPSGIYFYSTSAIGNRQAEIGMLLLMR